MSLLRNKYFYLGIIAAGVLLIALVVITLLSLKSFTRHGEVIILPDFEGEPIEKLQSFAKENDLRYVVIDSIYNDDLEAGTIVLQDPYGNSTVKRGRKIYVSIVSSLPESVTMPNVVNLSVRQAVSLIYGNDLTIEKLVFKSGFDKNAVQEQLIGSEAVEAGTKLKKNTPVILIVSSGDQRNFSKIPDLKGLTKDEAIKRIYQHSFNLGTVIESSHEETKKLRVVSQSPMPSNMNTFPLGHKINFQLSADEENIVPYDTLYNEGIDTSLMPYMQPDPEEYDSILEYEFEEEFEYEF